METATDKKPTIVIPLTACASSSILGHGYNAATGTLALKFKNATYHYAGVPAELFAQLQEAESIGRFFQDHIRGKYEAEKLPPPLPSDDAAAA